VALAVVLVFGFLTGARPVFARQQLDCGTGYYAQPVSILDGVYQCQLRPLRGFPSLGDQPRQTVTTRDEVGLYLTNLQVRVFDIDFVRGIYQWLASGVPDPRRATRVERRSHAANQ
jgi:hypothetical protein